MYRDDAKRGAETIRRLLTSPIQLALLFLALLGLSFADVYLNPHPFESIFSSSKPIAAVMGAIIWTGIGLSGAWTAMKVLESKATKEYEKPEIIQLRYAVVLFILAAGIFSVLMIAFGGLPGVKYTVGGLCLASMSSLIYLWIARDEGKRRVLFPLLTRRSLGNILVVMVGCICVCIAGTYILPHTTLLFAFFTQLLPWGILMGLTYTITLAIGLTLVQWAWRGIQT